MKIEFGHITGFQWDEGNLNKNLLKHTIENWECEQVFFNEALLIAVNLQHSDTEKRWAAFGRSDADRLLTIVFTIRASSIRIISARDMSRKEIKFYEKNY